MPRLLPALLATPLALTLAACCGSFSLDEPMTKTVTDLGANPESFEVEYDCSLEGGVVEPLDLACLLLTDQAKYLVELDQRYTKALTEEEKGKLGELRDEVLARLTADVGQLQGAVAQLEQPRADLRLAVVLALDEVSIIESAPGATSAIDSNTRIQGEGPMANSSISASFASVRVLSADQRPLGVILRQVSPAQALNMLVDDMRVFAVDKGYLSPETQAALGQ